MMVLTLAFWLLLTVLAAVGVYRLWTGLARPAHVNWALLPGTLVSEMAFILGCLITGGEIQRARLLPGRGGGRDSEPTTEASSTRGVRWLTPLVASLLSFIACGAAIVAAHQLLGTRVIHTFALTGALGRFLSGEGLAAGLPRELPMSWSAFWDQLVRQVRLVQGMSESWGELEWLDWKVPLFVYLAICLAVRLGGAGRDLRWTLAGAAIAAAVLALVALLSEDFKDLVKDLWPLVTYIWALLLFLLLLTLLLRGLVALGMILAGKKSPRV